MERLCVFCGSSAGVDPALLEEAGQLGATLAARGIGVVYGGGRLGLMGALADGALAAGGSVTGVIPRALLDREQAHRSLTELRVVTTMHQRKATMAELADAFVALPGGFGTLEELFEVVTWAQLGFHHKPVGLVNRGGFYDGLVAQLDTAARAGFIQPDNLGLLLVDDNVERLLRRLSEARERLLTASG
ncbi:MAG TPA: TIGR00730 family Rossman fold protein [Chloroflexota bacterium]